jgi:uncharacterized protein YdhG (YjbR/CyaY superfamily)
MDKRTKNEPAQSTPEDVDRYLSVLPPAEREALERIRKIVRSIAPDVTERISYQIPVFRLNRDLVGYSAQKNYCSFYIMSTAVAVAMKEELRSYDCYGMTLHFKPEAPLPQDLIERIVRAKLDEIRGQSSKK